MRLVNQTFDSLLAVTVTDCGSTSVDDTNLLFPAAGARCDAEPSLVLARPPGGYGLHFQPDHAEHGRGHARQPAQCHRRSTALRYEDIPKSSRGQGLLFQLNIKIYL